jgi:hypothetical protein
MSHGLSTPEFLRVSTGESLGGGATFLAGELPSILAGQFALAGAG